MNQSPLNIRWTVPGAPAPGYLTLAAAYDWLSNPPVLEASQDLFETDGIKLSSGYFRPLGNVEVSIRFEVEEEWSTLEELQDAFLGDLEIIDGVDLLEVSGNLAFVPDGGGATTTFPDAAISSLRGELPAEVGETGRATRLREFVMKTSLPL